MRSELESQIRIAIRAYNAETDFRRFALQRNRDMLALISSDRESGGFNVLVCPDDSWLEQAVEQALQEDQKPILRSIEDAFYSLSIQRWSARLWN